MKCLSVLLQVKLDIHKYLKEQRQFQGVTLREIGESLNVHRTTVAQFERGRNDWPLDQAHQYASILGVEEDFDNLVMRKLNYAGKGTPLTENGKNAAQ